MSVALVECILPAQGWQTKGASTHDSDSAARQSQHRWLHARTSYLLPLSRPHRWIRPCCSGRTPRWSACSSSCPLWVPRAGPIRSRLQRKGKVSNAVGSEFGQARGRVGAV